MTREEAIKILEEIIDEGWLISDLAIIDKYKAESEVEDGNED